MHTVYLGVGSNMGRRLKNCRSGLWMLQGYGAMVLKTSSPIETEPWGVENQPPFINMAASILTKLPPRQLLMALKDVERSMGREPEKKWAPRPIDLDILLYGEMILNEEGLVIPHPLMHERAFVLGPLAEIAPDVVHPVLGKTIRELLRELGRGEIADGHQQPL